jgi:hypothetical protein
MLLPACGRRRGNGGACELSALAEEGRGVSAPLLFLFRLIFQFYFVLFFSSLPASTHI